MNPEEAFHNTTYSVQLPYIAFKPVSSLISLYPTDPFVF